MAKGIIDRFEVVEIDNGEHEGAMRRIFEAGFQVAEEGAAVGQSGERVGIRFAQRAQLGVLADGDVADRDGVACNRARDPAWNIGARNGAYPSLEPDLFVVAQHRAFEHASPTRLGTGLEQHGEHEGLVQRVEEDRQRLAHQFCLAAQPLACRGGEPNQALAVEIEQRVVRMIGDELLECSFLFELAVQQLAMLERHRNRQREQQQHGKVELEKQHLVA